MNELLEYLKKQPKEVLQYIILELMRCDKLTFAEIAEAHISTLEELKQAKSEALISLRCKIVSMWADKKKNIGKNLTALMQEAKENGWANVRQEQIDKSKWNK